VSRYSFLYPTILILGGAANQSEPGYCIFLVEIAKQRCLLLTYCLLVITLRKLVLLIPRT